MNEITRLKEEITLCKEELARLKTECLRLKDNTAILICELKELRKTFKKFSQEQDREM